MAPHARRTGILILLIAIASSGALALKAPEVTRSAPAVIAPAMEDQSDLVDPIANGLVNRTSGAIAILIAQNEGPYPGSPEQAARSYLAERASSFGLSRMGNDLVAEYVKPSPGGQHVYFHQTVGSVPVWGADVMVTLDEAGRYVRAVSSSYDPILAHSAPATAPALDASRARELALAAVGVAGEPQWLGEAPASELWILREGDRVGMPASLAWRVHLPVREPLGDWEVFVDALSGTILRLNDRICYTDGSGYVFAPDPLTTAGVAYGGSYVDNNDADHAVLTAERVLVTLPELTLSGGVYHLRGPWCYLEDWDPPTSAPVTNPDPNGFVYTRNAQGFEDVMAYYHIDNNQRYMRSLGFTLIQAAPIRVDPHGCSGADNSYYVPSTNKIAWGEGGVDDAEDADVILHEYGHAIHNSIKPGWGSTTEQRSMGEGFGDYWAASYSRSISAYRSEWVFNWDGHNPFWGGRVLTSTQGYNNINGDIYHDGTIWASCWWLIFAELGRTVTDKVQLKGYYGVKTSDGMRQAAAYMMQADKDLYGGLHAGTLDYYFVLRQFLTASQFDVPVLTHTPLGDQTASGPYPVTVTISSTSAIVDGSVKVKYGIGLGGPFDHEVVLAPTGNPNEWGGGIPDEGGDCDISYYIIADNAATWRGATPRGAENIYNDFHIGPLARVEELGGQRVLGLRTPTPNPFSAQTTVRFDLPLAGSAKLSIHDVNGRLVRTLHEGDAVAGLHAIGWDGKSNDGHAVSSGLYFVRFEAQGQTFTRKVLFTK